MGSLVSARPDAQADGTASSNGTAPTSVRAGRLTVRSRIRSPRVVVGAALVVLSVVIGSMVIASADDRVMVWAASHDMSAGSEMTPADLVEVAVNLDAKSHYIDSSSTAIIGRHITRHIAAGELIPVSSVADSDTARRLVTIPVEPMHAPIGLQHGDQVDVYVSPRDSSGGGGASRLVLANALVGEASVSADSPTGEVAVVLDVTPEQAAALVGASRGGVLDLVRVPVTSK